MKRAVSSSVLAVVVAGLLMSVHVRGQAVQRYMVSVTNMTPGQTFTPILLATHTQAVRLFAAGTAATPELRELAEESNTDPLITLLRHSCAASAPTSGMRYRRQDCSCPA